MSDDPSVDLFVIGPLIFTVLLASLWAWRRAFDRLANGRTLLDYEPRRETPWGLVDLAITTFLFVVCPALVLSLLAKSYGIELPRELADMSPNLRALVLLGGAVATLGAFLLSVGWAHLRSGATLVDFGLDRGQLAADLRLGVTAFVMLAPIVYTIQMLLVNLVESKHPLIELLREDPDPKFFVISGLAAVVVAPLAEEYFFRVLLQGWLERLAVFRGDAMQILLGGRPDDPQSAESTSQPFAETTIIGDENPHQPPHTELTKDDTRAGSAGGTDGQLAPTWPILISALLFALAHYSHGPDPIPLFVLALALGYLYRQTHRILPCIVVHLLLNGCSLVVLWLAVYLGGQSSL